MPEPVPIPELFKFTIWCEGYKTAQKAGFAWKVGLILAANFPAACQAWATHHPEFAKHYSPTRNTHWGCRLFDNEDDARAAYG